MPQTSSNQFSIRIQASKRSVALPAWVPPPGYFADVPMLNNPQDVTPSIYQSGPADSAVMNNPFVLWGGSAILRDYSDLGAQVYYAGGHETSYSAPNVQFSLVCDFSSLRWSTANAPTTPNPFGAFINGVAPDGSPYCPHTYLGLQELPKAWGGGEKGSLMSFFYAPAPFPNRINLLDVSQSRMGYSQLSTRQPQNVDPAKIRFLANSDSGSFPITVMDQNRQGWWLATDGNADYLLFVAKSGEITQYPALGGSLANGALALCNSLNLLVAIDGGYVSGQYASNAYRTIHIRNLATGQVTKNTTLGTVPGLQDGYDGGTNNFCRPDSMGLQWVDELGCIVGLDQTTTPPTIVKLTPPASNPASSPWTWSRVTSLRHWQSDPSGQSALQSAQNQIWSKFRWVPSLHAFVYCTAKDRKPQVVRLS
jgi:hypothetical protein